MAGLVFAVILLIAAFSMLKYRGSIKSALPARIEGYRSVGSSYDASREMNSMKLLGGGSVFLLILAGIFFITSFIVSIPSGHVGVITTFGKVENILLREGLNFKAPWQECHVMSIREQVRHHVMNAASSKGIMIDLDLDVVYRLHPAAATRIYQMVGQDYYDILVDPLINRTAKDIMVLYMAEDMYTGMRPQVNQEIEEALRENLEDLGIVLLRAPITNMEIPLELKIALETRQVEEYNVQTAQQRLEQERVEAERKRVEAAGIRDFQAIVSEEISERLLYWKYIEVIGSMAESQNTTFVVMPTDVMANFPFGR